MEYAFQLRLHEGQQNPWVLWAIFFLSPRRERSSLKGYGAPGSGVYKLGLVPHYDGLNVELEKMQTRAARFVAKNYILKKVA